MKNKGITLIALIITIIILLILAGVTINLVTNESGIFSKAKQATEKYSRVANNELEEINNLQNQIDNYIGKSRSDNFKITTLWQYNPSASADDISSGRKTGEITLGESIDWYDEIVFLVQVYFSTTGEYGHASEYRFLTRNLLNTTSLGAPQFSCDKSLHDENRRMLFNVISSTKVEITKYELTRLLSITGIKY